MELLTMTNAMILKAKSRLEKSIYANQYQFDSTHESGFLIKGLYRSGKELIVSTNPDTDEFGLIPLVKTLPSSIKSNTASPVIKKPLEINLIKIEELDYDDSIFIPMKTNKPIDLMFSTDGGIYPATNYMIIGDPGIGKSTQTLDILAQVQKVDPNRKVLFISGEMNQIDMKGYVKRYPSFGKIPTLFLCDYVDENPMELLETLFNQSWDLVLIDSFIEVQEFIQTSCSITKTFAEKWLIDLMIQHNKGNNDGKRYTSFLAIQQVTKGGNFVGSNKLKHNTTGMIELRYSSEFSGDRYAKVTKNRRGFKYEKIYFSLDAFDSVDYDQKRIDRDLEIKERLSKEKELLLSEEEKFNQIFGIKAEVELTEE